MITLPKYEPPRFSEIEGGTLYDKVKGFFVFFRKYTEYHGTYFNRLRNILEADGSLAEFAPLASAETIRPLRPVQPIEGTVTIRYIYTPDYFNELKLLAVHGFVLESTGNIAVNRVYGPGEVAYLIFHIVHRKWYAVGGINQAALDYREER